MTRRQDLEVAAFWSDYVCLRCDEQFEAPDSEECPKCGAIPLVHCSDVMGFIERLEMEEQV